MDNIISQLNNKKSYITINIVNMSVNDSERLSNALKVNNSLEDLTLNLKFFMTNTFEIGLKNLPAPAEIITPPKKSLKTIKVIFVYFFIL